MRKKTLPVLLLSLLIFYFSAFAQKNISQSSAESGYPAVAVNKQGAILVVWPEGGDEAGTLFYSVFRDGAWSGKANAQITGIQAWSPQLDVDSDGNFHIAYADGRSRLNREIFHSKYILDSGWAQPAMIWLSPENSAWQRIDIDNDRIFILWHHEHSDPYQGYDIIYQTKMVDEEFWPSAYERVSWTAHDNSTHPGFKVRNDRLYAVYMEGVGDSAPWRLFFKEGERGTSWRDIPVEEVTGLGYRPDLEVDDNGNVHIVWATKTGNYMYRSKVSGTWRSAEVISSRFSPQQFGDIRYKNGILVAIWAQQDAGGQSVYYAKKTIGGKWENPVQIVQGRQALYPRVWLDDNGYAHFVWQDRGDIWYEKIAVPPSDPFLQLSTQALSFVIEGANPDPATLTVKNIGQRALSYNINVGQDWLSVLPTSGNLKKDEEDEIQLTVDAQNLDEGTHTGIIEFTSPEAINSPQQVTVTLEVLAPPIYPPLNFAGQVMENKSLFYREIMHKLTWESNPLNRDIEKYRLYEVDGVNYILLAELPSTTFEYTRRNIVKGKNYEYELWAIDQKGRTGSEPATLTLGTTVTSEKNLESSRIHITK